MIPRNIRFSILGRDSVNISLNENYLMIEDSCSVIIRQGHFNNLRRKFVGAFKDVSKSNPAVVFSKGTYSAIGLKTGEFVSYNLDGSLRSRGSYVDDMLNGSWEINYDNGKPEVVFTAKNDTISIESAWDKFGKKTVDKGKGAYAVNQGGLTWKGKLNNGRPDGLWYLYRTDDASENDLAIEQFKKGVFERGKNAVKEYKDESRIDLLNQELLPFLNAEKLMAAPPCDNIPGKHIVFAQYKNSTSNFTADLFNIIGSIVQRRAAAPVTLGNKDWLVDNTLTITGNISEKGELVDMKFASSIGGAFNGDLGQDIVRGFHRWLPVLEPATIDGKPVKQGFRIEIIFKNASFSISYKFLPITT